MLRRVEIDDAIDRAAGRVRRKPADDQLAPRRGLERDVHQPGGTQLVDDEHIGVLTQRGVGHGQCVLAVAANLALADEAADALVDDVDLVLDRNHVVAPRAVDQIDHRRNDRALAAGARAGDQDQTLRLDGQRLDDAREPELLRRDAAA